MKKLLTIALTFMMVGLLLTGCGTQNNPPNGIGSSANEQVESNDVDSTASEPVESDEYVPGTRTDNEYVSEEIGLKYTLSKDMTMATDDEINNMMQIGADVIYKDSETGDQMINYAKVTTIYEMMAVNVLDNSTLMVMAEKLPLSSMNEKQYVDVFKQQLSMSGAAPEFKEAVTEEIAGILFTRLDYTININDMVMQQTVLLKKVKDRMTAIMLSYQTPEQFDALISGISAL